MLVYSRRYWGLLLAVLFLATALVVLATSIWWPGPPDAPEYTEWERQVIEVMCELARDHPEDGIPGVCFTPPFNR